MIHNDNNNNTDKFRLLLLRVYWPTFRKEPTGQVWCADVVGAGREELILVALLFEMVLSCSFEIIFILDRCNRVRQCIPLWYVRGMNEYL